METVAVIGASENSNRVSHLACQLLRDYGHKVYAVSLHGRDISGTIGRLKVTDIPEPLDTATIYVGPARQPQLMDELIEVNPRRVIFNPGSESEQSERQLKTAGIEVVLACTLVLLNTDQF
ncbi:MAG: CoA-binding protein [Pirellulaceae bacterium]